MPEDINNPVQNLPSNPEFNSTNQEPIVSITNHNHRLLIITGLTLVALIVATFTIAYSQGMLGGTTNSYTASSSSPSATPVVTDDVKSLQDSSAQMGSDLNDLDQANTELNNIDTSGDEPPSF